MTSTKALRTEDMALAVGAKALHEGRRFMYEQGEKYRGSFIDPKTGVFYTKYLEERPCPLCDSNDIAFLFLKGGGSYVKCTACSMIFQNPVFTDLALENYYTEYSMVQSQVVNNESDFYKRIYSRGLDIIEEFTTKERILDIGCSAGFFLDCAKQRGWHTYGVDYNKLETKVAGAKGHLIFNGDLAQSNFTDQFTAITMWDVIEHIKNGSLILNTIKKYLAKKGVLFIQTPSTDSLAARIMHENCNMFDGLEHVNLYSPRTMVRLAETNGYTVVKMETVISEIPVIANHLNYDHPYYGSTEHAGKILGIIDEQTLHNNLLGYKMQIALQLN